MTFGLWVLCYIVGTAIVAVCIAAIPGPGGEAVAHGGHDHGHGHGGH